MPTVSGNYVAPTWSNDAPPAINASELQAMSDAIQRSDQNMDYVFSFGDGATGTTAEDITTHPSNYYYLDTGETLNIPCSDYMLELDIHGYGRVGAANTVALGLQIIYDGGVYEQTISNDVAMDTIGEVFWHGLSKRIFFTGGTVLTRSVSYYGNDQRFQLIHITGKDLTNETIKRIRIRGVNAGNTCLKGVIKLTRIKNRG